MRSPSKSPDIAFSQITLPYKAGEKQFTYFRDIDEMELHYILDALIDENMGLEWDGPIEVTYRFKDGSAEQFILPFCPMED